MEIDFKQFRPSLVGKIEKSIELLHKALPVAKKYDPDNGFHLAFSGGKDSQALYHIAQLAQVPFKAHMMLTSVDPHEVILFVKRQYPDVVLHKPKDSIYNLAVKKKFLLPSRIIRWCCAELKEVGGVGTVCLTGIRKQESVKRSKRQEVEVSNRSFAGDFEGFERWQLETISKKLKTSTKTSSLNTSHPKFSVSMAKTKSLSTLCSTGLSVTFGSFLIRLSKCHIVSCTTKAGRE